jgi:hypothetical protein
MENTIHNTVSSTTFVDEDDKLIIAQTQDISALVEHNKALYAQSMDNKGWDGNNALSPKNKVASIPLVVFQELEKQGITRGLQVLDMDRFKAFLNNPDNQVFRTRMGRI